MEVDESRFVLSPSALDACRDAHAIVVLTEWDCFRSYDYSEFYRAMQKPAFVFDGRNMLDHAALERVGFEVHALGKAEISSKKSVAERSLA